MILRRNFLPRTFSDFVASIFLLVCIPLTFWFEIFIVVPEFHIPGSLIYNFTFVAAIFLLANVTANMLAVILCDTSIRGRLLIPPDDLVARKKWRLCAVCEVLAPPRSWHCQNCNVCILKRDHHCIFTGCCIGHENHRFFMMFILFIFVGCTYASFYNHIFIWYKHADIYANWFTALKLAMPLLMLTLATSTGNAYLFIYELNLIAVAISGALIVYHGKIIFKGGVVHERNLPHYDFGWKNNLKMVFGKRWYLIWIAPFIKSELPHDGIHWEKTCVDSQKIK